MEVGQPGLFDPDERYRRLSENGDPPLARLSAPIDFERLRSAAEKLRGVEKTLYDGESISAVARRNCVAP